MSRLVVGFLCGALFAVGLVLAGMTDPNKVIAFLDVTGVWDPSLAFVMGGAIAVFMPGYFLLARRRRTPILTRSFEVPNTKIIDARLLGGAAVFGVGWGTSGFCPGPAITSVATGSVGALIFVGGMAAAMFAYERLRG